MRLASSGCAKTCSTRSARARTSPGSVRKPVNPSRTTSAAPSTRVPTTVTPPASQPQHGRKAPLFTFSLDGLAQLTVPDQQELHIGSDAMHQVCHTHKVHGSLLRLERRNHPHHGPGWLKAQLPLLLRDVHSDLPERREVNPA